MKSRGSDRSRRRRSLIRNRRIQTGIMYDVAVFPMNDELFNIFERKGGYRTDCVINALEFIGIATPTSAGAMRIVQNACCPSGLTTTIIQDIFNTLYSDIDWRFIRYTNDVKYLDHLTSSIHMNQVAFCGITWSATDSKHVFLIARTDMDQLVIIDGQTDQRILGNKEAMDYLSKGKEWFILKRRDTTPL